VLEPGRGARDAAGGGADVEHLDRAAEVDRDRDQFRAALDAVEAPSGDEEVDQHLALLLGQARIVDEHEPAGPESRQRALGHERGEDGGDRGVDRVPALAQDPRAGLGSQLVACGHHSPRAAHPAQLRRAAS
jgi:hypothetical protein